MDKVVWTNEYMEKFGLAFIKYEPLYQKPKSNSLDKGKKRVKISDCHKQLARELGWRSFRKSSIVHQCVTFKKKFMDMLRQLVWDAADEAPAEEVLRAAPVWVRTVEAALQCVPTIKAEASSSTWSSPKAVSLLASRLAAEMAREALRRRSVCADALAPARARLAALTAHRLDADAVHALWERVQRVALGKLALSAAAGDDALGVAEGARLEPHDWLVLDALLLYADTDVTGAESYLLYEQLQPLIDVFHLVQMHHLEDPDHPEPLAVRWTRAYNNYAAKGLSASLVLLQRRWYELKQWARRGVLARWRRRADCQLYPLHVAVAKRFPHVVTGPLPRWEELVAAGQVVVEPVDLGEADVNKHPPDNPVSSQGLNENYIETEDDLILIEENIETVDLEDEDDIPHDDDKNDESEAVKNCNDEAVKNDRDPNNTTECMEVIVVNEGSKESSSVKNVEPEKDKEITDNTETAGEIADNTKTAGEITDTTETDETTDNTLTVGEKIDNTKTADVIKDNTKTVGEITDTTKTDETTDNTLTVGEKVDNTKTADLITDNTKTAGEITDTTKTGETTDNTLTVGEKMDNTKTAGEIIENTLTVSEKIDYTTIVAEITDNTNEETGETLDNEYDDDDDNDMQIDDTCIETPAFLDSIEDSLSNIESNKSENTVPPITKTTSEDSTQKDGVDNMNAEPEKQEYSYESPIEKEPKMIGINKIKEKAEQEIAILSKLEQLDPDKVQTEITFESDSDVDTSRGASPLPSTSGAKYANKMSDEDSAEDSNMEPDFKEDEDVGSKIVNENTVKVKKEINESKSEDTNLSRFLFVDDVNTAQNSDTSEDELCIADIKRRKKSETLKNRIQFECEDMIQKESNDANEPTPRQRHFALNIIPLSDLNDIDQSDIQNFLNQEKKHEAPEDNVNFNFGENIRAMSATALGERRTSKATKRTQGCSEDRGKRKRRQTDDDSESECEGGGGGAGRRAPKRVQLPDIEQVRRANGRTPTAQVPPLASAPPAPRPRRSSRRKTTDVTDEETSESSSTEKQEKRDKRKSSDNATTKVGEEDASTPNQRELFQFLENIADTSRGVAQQRRSGAKVAYCCVARRHRAVNDARRRLAAKAGHARPPQPLPLHSGAHLRECACCCVHLVEELSRDEAVAAEQRALRGDLATLLLGRRAGAKPTHAPPPKPPSKKSKTQDNKDKDSNGSKMEEKEGNNSADPNESSELDSDNDTDLMIDMDYNEESSDKVISNDEDKPVTSRARRKKKADTKEPAVTPNKVSDSGEKTHTDPENDPGYQEWIRQKNLTTKFFGLGPPKENEDKPKYSIKKDNLSNQISMNYSLESSKQNLVSVDKTIEETVPKLDGQVTATDDHIDGIEPFASVKITSISGSVVSNFNIASAPKKAAGSILRRPSEAVEPLWSCVTVERFLEGRDPTTVRLLRVNIECCDRAYIFVTEAEHPVQNSAYCTLAPWRSMQRILFAVDEDEDWGAPKAMPHLLGSGCSPDTISLADKYYKKLSEKPLVYAQVFSMIAAVVDCRSLLMRGKPVWAYCKADGCLRPISVAALGPHNVGLMCDDNGAVQELVDQLNLISGVQPKEDEGESTIGHDVEVMKVESDDNVAIVE